MYVEFNFVRDESEPADCTICSRMQGSVFDYDLSSDDEEARIGIAEFSFYLIDQHYAFTIGLPNWDEILFDTETSIDALREFLESGHTDRNFIYMEEIVVQPEFRRRGVLKTIIETVGRLWSESPLVLCACPLKDMSEKVTQEELGSWYASLGFKHLAGLTQYYIMWRDAADYDPVDEAEREKIEREIMREEILQELQG